MNKDEIIEALSDRLGKTNKAIDNATSIMKNEFGETEEYLILAEELAPNETLLVKIESLSILPENFWVVVEKYLENHSNSAEVKRNDALHRYCNDNKEGLSELEIKWMERHYPDIEEALKKSNIELYAKALMASISK